MPESMDIYGLITCVIEAFRYFGGLTNAVLRDHTKTVVIGTAKRGMELQPKSWIYALPWSIHQTTPAKRAWTKGKVEASIRYERELLAG